MDLVERYIEAIKFWLPKHLKEDIAAELREDIQSEIEEAEREKGRKLTEDEVAAILKARGRPLYVASQYMPRRTLIGPEIYPIYIFVLKIVVIVNLIAPAVSLMAWLLSGANPPVPSNVSSPFTGLLISFAIVTFVFAVIERKGVNPNMMDNWTPKTLRPVVDKNRIKRSESVGDIVANLILIGFFTAGYLSQTHYELFNGSITLAPQWIPYCQFITAVAVGELAFSAANLFSPYWTGLRIAARLTIDVVKTAALFWLLQAHFLRDIAAPGLQPGEASQIIAVSDSLATWAAPLCGFIMVGVCIAAVVRAIRLASRGTPVAA